MRRILPLTAVLSVFGWGIVPTVNAARTSDEAPPSGFDHPPIPSGSTAPSAQELIEKLDAQPDVKSRPKSFEVALSMAKLYYGEGRMKDAEVLLREARQKADPVKALAKTLKKEKIKPAGACPVEGFEAVSAEAATAYKAGKKDIAQACVNHALVLGVVEAERLWAYTQVLGEKPAVALETLGGILEISDDAESRYAKAALLLETQGDDRAAIQEARSNLEILAKAPANPRSASAQALLQRVQAIQKAGGVTAFGAQQDKKYKGIQVATPPAPTAPFAGAGTGSPPPLTKEMVDAVQNTERTPELEKGLGELVEQAEALLAKDQFQEALDAYKRVVPFQPDNARARAGMAWSLVGLNRQPMADRVWQVAVTGDASAIDQLGDILKAKGNVRGAQALWSKLKASAPDYAAKAGVAEKLR